MDDVIPECPRTPYRNRNNDFQVLFLKKGRADNVFEVEFKPNEDVFDNLKSVLSKMYETCSSKSKIFTHLSSILEWWPDYNFLFSISFLLL